MKSSLSISLAPSPPSAIFAAAGISTRAADAPPIKLGQIEDSSGNFAAAGDA